MNRVLVALLSVALIAATAQAQGPGQQRARQQALQGQIVERFVTHAAAQLGLDAERRDRLEQHLRESGARRRDLAQQSMQLRRRMIESVRDSATADAEFRRLLADATALREREDQLWKTEQQELARFLTPRQQVQFVFMWLRFNDQVRDAALRPPGRPGPGWNRP